MTVGSIGGTYGLSGSGLDIDSIVKKLMAGQQAKDDALVQKKTVLQWQKAAYNTVYDDISNFRNAVFNYKLQATLSPNKVTSSNTSVATATANAGAADVNHSLVVAQLASGVNLTSSASISSTQPPTLGTLATQMGVATNAFQFTITNGTTASQPISIDPSTNSINDVVSAINNAGVNVTASYDSTLDRMFLTTTNTGSSTGISIKSSATSGSTDYAATFIGKLNLFPTIAGVASTATVAYAGNSLAITNAGGQNLNTVTIAKSVATVGVAAKSSMTDTTFNVTAGVNGTSLNGVNVAFSTAMTGTTAATALTSAWDAANHTLTISGNLSSSGSAATNSTAITSAMQSGLTAAGFKVGTMADSPGTLGTAGAFAGSSITFSGGVTNIPNTDTMAVDENNGNLTIYLADTTASYNTATNIQTAVHALGSGSTDFSKYTFAGQGSWDTTTLGQNIPQAVGTLTGGTTPSVAVSTNTSTNTTTTTYSSVAGKNAMFTLDNTALTEASNTFTISGVAYSLTGVTPSGSPATAVSVTGDIDTAVASIQSLVDSYNKILAEVNGKVNEERYTDYPPLTDAQKAAMKDSDITAWTAKAQSGMLHNDTTLTSLVNTMRSALSSPVSGIVATNVNGTSVTYNSAASIGITTGDYTEGGKLYLDSNKLRTALQANPNVLNQLFGAAGTTTTGGVTTTNSQSQGIAGRLYDGIKNTMDQLNQIAGTTASAQYDTNSNVAKQIAAYNTQISDATTTFNTMQSSYYTQYNAMEVAIQQLNSQSSWLSSQLGTSTTAG